MSLVAFLFFLVWLSFCFAKVEIAIEGPHGWAENLPTWRLPRDHWASKLFFSGKPATGYHTWMELFIVSVLHLVYVFVTPSWAVESQLLSFFFFFCVFEDFFWFVFNPAFGIKNFRPEKIWWHREHWWWIAPRDYYVFLAVGTFLYWLSFHF